MKNLILILSFSCFAAVSARGAAIIAGQWDIETSDTLPTLTDSSGFNRDGTVVGGATLITTGLAPVPGGTTAALNFDGTDDEVNITGYKGVTGTGARSVSAWIRTTDTIANQNMDIISWGANVNGDKWVFRVNAQNGTQGTLRVEVNGGYQVGATVVTDGLWHHVALTWEDDGTPNVDDALLYVDGLLDANSATNPNVVGTASSQDVRLGGETFSARRWKGDLDEIRVYSSVLTGGEIAALAGIPEPSAFLLASLGIFGLVLRRRRR